jgi:hypothetical protein
MEKNQSQQLTWLNRETEKDRLELEREKNNLINQIRKINKEEIFEEKIEKLTLWDRIKKVLMG